MFLASGGCWTSLWLYERQSGRSTAGAVWKRPEMTDRAFVYPAIIIGTLAISLDFASVDLALPALEARYGLDLASVQWVINGYVLAFAVLMVAGGRLADGYGRRNVFLVGMAIFALASLLGGLAWSGGSVIGFRVLQGVGGDPGPVFLRGGNLSAVLHRFALRHPVRHEVPGQRSDMGRCAGGSVQC
jgi:predicted MFS family arabinose efflux permease